MALKLGAAFEKAEAKDMMHEDTLADHYQVLGKPSSVRLHLAFLCCFETAHMCHTCSVGVRLLMCLVFQEWDLYTRLRCSNGTLPGLPRGALLCLASASYWGVQCGSSVAVL